MPRKQLDIAWFLGESGHFIDPATGKKTTWKREPAHGSFWVGRPLGDDEPHGDWLVAYRIAPQDDQLVIAEIRVLPWPTTENERRWITETLRDPEPRKWAAPPPIPEAGLSARAVRSGIRTGEALEQARKDLTISFDVTDENPKLAEHSEVPAGFTREMLKAPRRPGRQGRDDRFYAELASVYLEAVAAKSPHPVQDVRKRLSKERNEHYSEASVRALIHQARRRGLLTRSPRGQAGGQLTGKAVALLKREDESK